MDDFLSTENVQGNKIVDGNTRKVLSPSRDGTRADAMANLFYDANNFDTNGYNYEAADYSGLHRLKESGGYTWPVTVDEKYYGINYDGFKENT